MTLFLLYPGQERGERFAPETNLKRPPKRIWNLGSPCETKSNMKIYKIFQQLRQSWWSIHYGGFGRLWSLIIHSQSIGRGPRSKWQQYVCVRLTYASILMVNWQWQTPLKIIFWEDGSLLDGAASPLSPRNPCGIPPPKTEWSSTNSISRWWVNPFWFVVMFWLVWWRQTSSEHMRVIIMINIIDF